DLPRALNERLVVPTIYTAPDPERNARANMIDNAFLPPEPCSTDGEGEGEGEERETGIPAPAAKRSQEKRLRESERERDVVMSPESDSESSMEAETLGRVDASMGAASQAVSNTLLLPADYLTAVLKESADTLGFGVTDPRFVYGTKLPSDDEGVSNNGTDRNGEVEIFSPPMPSNPHEQGLLSEPEREVPGHHRVRRHSICGSDLSTFRVRRLVRSNSIP
ncbi:hypothetical protein KIPB_011134, partial [Kipferlia bialata]